jgi:hypothetical protein
MKIIGSTNCGCGLNTSDTKITDLLVGTSAKYLDSATGRAGAGDRRYSNTDVSMSLAVRLG